MKVLRALAVVGIVAVGVVGFAPAAGADPAEPGNYDSHVLRITPPTDAITAKVVGGDGFLDLKVERGHTVDLAGYQGEPWLRIGKDGLVERNDASSATYLNETRYGSEIPDWVDKDSATANPQWETIGHDGRYIWHDHRIHWMNKNNPPETVPGTNRAIISDRDDGTWYIPIVVDGTEHEIIGEALLLDAPSPLPQWLLVIVLIGALTAVGFTLRPSASRIAAGALVVVGALSLWAGASELSAVPAAAGGNPIWVALPITCVVVALAGLAFRSAAARAIAVLAAAAALAVWGALRIPALDKALPLGSLDPTLTRFIIAAAIGTAVGAVVAAIASGGLKLQLPSLDDDDDDDGDGDGDGDGDDRDSATASTTPAVS